MSLYKIGGSPVLAAVPILNFWEPMLTCSHWGMFPGRRKVGERDLIPVFECTEFW